MFRSQVVGVVQVRHNFFTGDRTLSSPGGAGFNLEPQPINDRPVGLRFPHLAGQFRSWGSPLSSPTCMGCKGMEVLLIRRWDPIVPRCRRLCSRTPVHQRLLGWVGISTPCGAISTRGIFVFVSGALDLHRYGSLYHPWMRPYPPRVQWGLDVGPGGNSRRARRGPSLAEGRSRGGLGQ